MRLNAAVLALAALLCVAALVPATADGSVSVANKHGPSTHKPKCYIPLTLAPPTTVSYITTFLGMSVFTGACFCACVVFCVVLAAAAAAARCL